MTPNPGGFVLYLPLLFLVASFVLAIVRRGVSVGDLALWAIASSMILPLVLK